MKLKVLQQIHISAIRSDTMRPGEVIEVDDARGADLLHSLPDTFEQTADLAPEPVAEPAAKPSKGRAGRKAIA